MGNKMQKCIDLGCPETARQSFHGDIITIAHTGAFSTYSPAMLEQSSERYGAGRAVRLDSRVGGQALQRGNNCRQRIYELLALFVRQRIENALIDAPRERLCRTQHAPPLVRQLDGVGTRILTSAPALQEPFSLQTAHQIGKR